MANAKPGKPSGAKQPVVTKTPRRHRPPKPDPKPPKDTEAQAKIAKGARWRLVVGPTGSKRMKLE